jgi:ankyrin repeat protein
VRIFGSEEVKNESGLATLARSLARLLRERAGTLAIVALIVLPVIAAVYATNPTPAERTDAEEARHRIARYGFPYTEDSFVRRAREGNAQMVRLYLHSGMNPNARDREGDTALIAAASNDRREIALDLLKAKADIEARDQNGLTPLICAARFCQTNHMLLMLIERGADVNAHSNNGATALMYASLRGDSDIVQALLDHGAQVEARDASGGTPLTWAAFYGATGMVHLLLERGADPNAKNNYGVTPVMLAAGRGYVEIAQDLLDHGADAGAKDNEGKSALAWARELKHEEVAQLLEEAEARRKARKP